MTEPLQKRMDYTQGTLEDTDVMDNPIEQLKRWLEDAANAQVIEPNAMTVSTVALNGQPSSRVVLLRGLDERGLTFYTNYESRKGQEIAATGAACIGFWWGALERQTRVEGRIQRVSAEESDAYFASRPYESQLASAASPQSQTITRDDLEESVETLRQVHPERVPRPEHWGGYRLVPDYMEFWQGRKARLHDRIVYTRDLEVWVRSRIAP
jgi:pyridoxamine 5'-phosphate oxidase